MKNKPLNRREFISQSTKASIAVGVGISAATSILQGCGPIKASTSSMPQVWAPGYQQTPLPYAYEALEPVIDKETMNIHFNKHAATYAKNLADAAIAENISPATVSLPMLLGNISKYTAKMRNNAGGHYNHELFWQLMKPGGNKQPGNALSAAIAKDFGSFDAFKKQFEDAGKGRFGSGWAWLIHSKDGKLLVASSPNQDNPLMDIADVKGTPILGLDVWEHAYYLKYQNRRADYISAWWNVVNWSEVDMRFV